MATQNVIILILYVGQLFTEKNGQLPIHVMSKFYQKRRTRVYNLLDNNLLW